MSELIDVEPADNQEVLNRQAYSLAMDIEENQPDSEVSEIERIWIGVDHVRLVMLPGSNSLIEVPDGYTVDYIYADKRIHIGIEVPDLDA